MAVEAARSLPIGFSARWPLAVWSGFGFFVILVSGLSFAAWFYYRREEENLTLSLSFLLLPIILPILVVNFVRFFAIR